MTQTWGAWADGLVVRKAPPSPLRESPRSLESLGLTFLDTWPLKARHPILPTIGPKWWNEV